MAAIPLYLVTGFLGSGKTTFLKEAITECSPKKNVAIIQNEFAPENIDGEELRQLKKPFEILEINNGSVFCVCLLSDFITSLKSFILEVSPDLVILESSGLSDPIAIAEILQSPELINHVYLAHSYCIVDVLNYKNIQNLMTRVRHQILIADTIILNKIDKTNSKQTRSVRQLVFDINSKAKIMETSYCQIGPDQFFRNNDLKISKNKEHKSVEDSCGRPPIKARVFKTSKKISYENLKNLLDNLLPGTQRIKGYVLLDNQKTASVQSVFNSIDIKVEEDIMMNTALIFMGDNFNLSQFSKNFREIAK